MAEMTKRDLMALLKRDLATKQKIAELRGEWRADFGKATAAFDVHPKALNVARWIHRNLEEKPDDVRVVLNQINLFARWLVPEGQQRDGKADKVEQHEARAAA